MAQLHRAEPTGQRAWSEAEFSAMLSANNALSVTCDAGFAVGQVILDEAELFLIMT
ncbi:MAG: ribosomal-protein-alanine acetyltransferase, partial [Rhodobacteraceae bacterium]|nr:ribosomal-protein-alanine acetyltransferase [Paracoccaceae bacterium]